MCCRRHTFGIQHPASSIQYKKIGRKNMSSERKMIKKNIPYILQLKQKKEKISALTAYDYLMAEMLDESGIDIILIGDSAAMVICGEENTLRIGMEEILYHTTIVARAVKQALVVADMPFMSYQASIEKGLENAGRLIKAGAEAVKVEGGAHMVGLIQKLTTIGIPVMAHLGLTPQSVNVFGGYPLQAKNHNSQEKLKEDAKMVQDAGAFSIVLEKIPAQLGKEVSELLHIPTIGIGAGNECDGQILVTHDMLGIFDKFKPKFVRRYAEIGKNMREAFTQYNEDVKKGNFPADKESF